MGDLESKEVKPSPESVEFLIVQRMTPQDFAALKQEQAADGCFVLQSKILFRLRGTSENEVDTRKRHPAQLEESVWEIGGFRQWDRDKSGCSETAGPSEKHVDNSAGSFVASALRGQESDASEKILPMKERMLVCRSEDLEKVVKANASGFGCLVDPRNGWEEAVEITPVEEMNIGSGQIMNAAEREQGGRCGFSPPDESVARQVVDAAMARILSGETSGWHLVAWTSSVIVLVRRGASACSRQVETKLLTFSHNKIPCGFTELIQVSSDGTQPS